MPVDQLEVGWRAADGDGREVVRAGAKSSTSGATSVRDEADRGPAGDRFGSRRGNVERELIAKVPDGPRTRGRHGERDAWFRIRHGGGGPAAGNEAISSNGRATERPRVRIIGPTYGRLALLPGGKSYFAGAGPPACSSSRMPPSDARRRSPRTAGTPACRASVAIGAERLEIPLRDQVLRRVAGGADRLRDHLNRLRLGLRDAQPRLACPSAARIAACFAPSALTICDCFWPSARRIADDFSPSAVVTTARRVRSAVICFSIVRRISSGGVMFFSSMRITLTPHCCVAVSSAARSCEFVVSREASV